MGLMTTKVFLFDVLVQKTDTVPSSLDAQMIDLNSKAPRLVILKCAVNVMAGNPAISSHPMDPRREPKLPRNLGGSGYFGTEAMYLQTSTVATALDTEGVTLDFFRIFAKIIFLSQIEFECYCMIRLPLVPAQGGAEVALRLYYIIDIFHLWNLHAPCAVRQLGPCVHCVKAVVFSKGHT